MSDDIRLKWRILKRAQQIIREFRLEKPKRLEIDRFVREARLRGKKE